MNSLLLAGLLLLNFGISWWNAKVAGSIWLETKAEGGWMRLITWCAAIQSACGFTSVFALLFAGIAYATGYLHIDGVKYVSELTYVLIIFPAMGSGFLITIQSYIQAYREHSLMNMGTAAWNTFAMAKNSYDAYEDLGGVFSDLGGLFKGDDDDDAKSKLGLLVVLIVACAAIAGVLLTYAIVRANIHALPVPDREEGWTERKTAA